MSFAFGHLIGAWIIGKIYEFGRKKKLSHYTWFFLLLGGILPDTDFLLDWVFGIQTHRTFTHSFLFAIIIFLMVDLIFTLAKNKEHRTFAAAIGVGICTHLFLDLFSALGVPLFWPSTIYVAYNHLQYHPLVTSFLHASPEELLHGMKLAVADMALGTAWIFYLWWKKKVEL